LGLADGQPTSCLEQENAVLIQKTIQRFSNTYREYPRAFWLMVVATFIDHIGGFLLFPFFALYLTARFGVSMASVGVLFALFSVSGLVGSGLGGGLADHFGRKRMIILGLILSSLSALTMGLVGSFQAFFALAVTVGLLSDIAGPAQQAMVADLLPEEKRADGYGMIRVAFNVSAVIGPAIGGLLAAHSYLLLFIADAVISLLTAAFVAFMLPETKPAAHAGENTASFGRTLAGYAQVFRHSAFMLFLGAMMLLSVTYINMNTTLGVFLRNVHGTSTAGYGMLLSLNAVLVVILQFPITRRIQRFPPMLMLALGALLYALGFGMFGFVAVYGLFVLAMVIITIGEMIVAPVAQALVAGFAPEDMRGRYMAVSGLSWALPSAIGPYLAGLLLDGPRPQLLWYAAGLFAVLSGLGFVGLHGTRREPIEQPHALPESM
jgi:MFS family permease